MQINPTNADVCMCAHEDTPVGDKKHTAVIQDRLDGSDPKIVCCVDIPGGNGTWHAHCTKDEQY